MFETAPRPSAGSAVRFALSGDADATPGTNGKPAYNRYEVYGRMAAERNDFNVNLGDTIYSDSEVGGAPFARTLAQKWAKYRLGLALPALRRLRASAALYSHWDDHEFVNDFSPPEHGGAIYGAGAQGVPRLRARVRGRAGPLPDVPLGEAPGALLPRRALLPERRRRRLPVTATSPRPCPRRCATRSRRSHRRCRNPVPPACLALTDPTRTMLGAASTPRSRGRSQRSTATWKVVVNEVPIQQYYALPYDRWEGYAAERERLLRFLQANARNVVFLTTDSHANFVNEVRHRTLGASPESSGIWEVVTGPVATNTFSNEIDSFLGAAGAAAAIGAIFFKPPPPSGMGMRCAALDTYSYAQVTVRARTLTVALKDARGRPVREGEGDAVCAARPARPLIGPRRRVPCPQAPVAQWTERRTSNPRVGGSNPAGRMDPARTRMARAGGVAPCRLPASRLLGQLSPRSRRACAGPGSARRAFSVVGTYCTLAVTEALPFSVNVQVFVLLPPLEQAPDQMTSRSFVARSVIAVPTANDASRCCRRRR